MDVFISRVGSTFHIPIQLFPVAFPFQVEETASKLTESNEALKAELTSLKADHAKCAPEIEQLQQLAEKGNEFGVKAQKLEQELKELRLENETLMDNYNSERVLRKKYFNVIEDMKGKIRVYCRSRPLSKTEFGRGNVAIVNSPDEYTIHVKTSRGIKEFAFDRFRKIVKSSSHA